MCVCVCVCVYHISNRYFMHLPLLRASSMYIYMYTYVYILPSGAIDEALGWLASLIYGRRTLVPRRAQLLDLQSWLGLVWNFSPSCPRSFFPYFILLFLLFRPCCSRARGILCGIHTPCMGSPFPAVHAEQSLVFWSFRIMLVGKGPL